MLREDPCHGSAVATSDVVNSFHADARSIDLGGHIWEQWSPMHYLAKCGGILASSLSWQSGQILHLLSCDGGCIG